MKVSIFTDGSYSNPYGGFGVVFVAITARGKRMKKHSSKRYTGTTNNRMELKAIIHALESCDAGHQIDIYSDSEYCINTANQWLDGWIKKGKLDTKKNPELWRRFIKIRDYHINNGSKLKFIWIRGHAHTELNHVADKLANEARLIDNKKPTVECKNYN